MRTTLIFVFTFFNFCASAQLHEGFDKQEAKELIAICNSFTYLDLYGDDSEILPKGYVKRYTSGVFGMDNKYQIYQKGHVAVINLRGSTDKKISWMENIYSAMIPARGTIEIPGEKVPYCFAKDTSAAVHGGYALAIAYLSSDILYHIKMLNNEGLYDFIITGHSQGGALANLLRAYLENVPAEQLSYKNRFKTYAFAAPMVGNKSFVAEYNGKYCSDYSSFNIVNTADPIPNFPVTYEQGGSFSDNLKSMLLEGGSVDFKKLLSQSLLSMFEENLTNTVQKFSNNVSTQISKDLGPAKLPAYVADINYKILGNRIELPPVVYPKILKDSTILQNDSLMAVYKRGSDGQFLNQELYKKESWAYQHKPYNYYVAVLETYFPREYVALKKKYLAENL